MLHDEEQPVRALVHGGVIDGGDVGVLQLGGDQGLTAEAGVQLPAEPGLTALLAGEVETWWRQPESSAAARLGMLALMARTHDGVPWLLTDEAPAFDVAGAPSGLLAELDTYPQISTAICRWIQQCLPGEVYEAVLGHVRKALDGRVGLRAFTALLLQLGHARRADGSPADQGLRQALGSDPDVRALLPEVVATA